MTIQTDELQTTNMLFGGKKRGGGKVGTGKDFMAIKKEKKRRYEGKREREREL